MIILIAKPSLRFIEKSYNTNLKLNETNLNKALKK